MPSVRMKIYVIKFENLSIRTQVYMPMQLTIWMIGVLFG